MSSKQPEDLNLWEFAQSEFPCWANAVQKWGRLNAFTLSEKDRRRAIREALEQPCPPETPEEMDRAVREAIGRRADMLRFRAEAIVVYTLPHKIRNRLRAGGYEVSGKIWGAGSRVPLEPRDFANLRIDLLKKEITGNAGPYGEILIRRQSSSRLPHVSRQGEAAPERSADAAPEPALRPQGRPSAMHIVEAEMRRRAGAVPCELTGKLGDDCDDLANWVRPICAAMKPPVQAPGPKTIARKLGQVYRKLTKTLARAPN